MSYTAFDDEANEQMDEAIKTHQEYRDALERAEKFFFDFRWDTRDSGELTKVNPTTGEVVATLGPKNEEKTALYEKYLREQAAARQEFADCDRRAAICARGNVSAGIGRVPDLVVRILEVLWRRKLMDYYMVIGTHALYAYESAARVTFDSSSLATNDVDLLWNVDLRLKFVQTMERQGVSMIDVLREADPTFERNEEQKESAINDRNFSVDFLRKDEAERFSGAFPISDKEGDVYPVEARESRDFYNGPVFESAVVGTSGRMTVMRTIDPGIFTKFKQWMSGLGDREILKRNRDKSQAAAVAQLLNEGLLKSKVAKT